MVFIAFKQYNVKVVISTVYEYELTFPSITICNLTPINRSALADTPGLEKLKNIVKLEPTATVSRKKRCKYFNANKTSTSNCYY